MHICNSIADFRNFRRPLVDRKIVFVPTMGALHEGHGSLVQLARRLAGANGIVAVSIFVNPTQFGPNEDFHKYPRPFEQDLTNLTRWETDVVFSPSPQDMYPAENMITIDPGPLGKVLDGAIRPGHFQGVCTVVAKLLGIIGPDVMILGQKDYQQQLILRQMVTDLNMPVEIVTAATMREPDGLAMSSRNQYLSPDQRPRAGAIYQALILAQQQYQSGVREAAVLQAGMIEKLTHAGMEHQYALACNAQTLIPFSDKVDAPCVLLIAAKLGTTRLIDNLILS